MKNEEKKPAPKGKFDAGRAVGKPLRYLTEL